jgi:HemY protein
MIRVVAFLILAGLAAAGAVWLADRPGEIAITWLGYRIDTSMMVALGALALIVVAAMILWSALRLALRSPTIAAAALRERRERKGYEAISSGLIAIGAGDMRAAQRHAGTAARNAPDEPLALLLRAQTAQLSGDRAAADAAFRAMSDRADMRVLGLRGLYVEAQRRADFGAALRFAEEAATTSPAVPWANQAVLEFRCAAADWTGALAVLENNRKSGVLDRETYRRQRAVLLTARALSAEDGERDAARGLALDAVKLAPDLVPAAALAGRLLAEVGETRKAGKIVEAAWKQNPHPDLAEAYAHVRLSDSARDRLARIERLAREPAGHPEGALAVARAALDAREFATARAALAPLTAAPPQRVAVLMAELEKLEHNDEGRAREWMARALRAARDPAWTADGFVSDRWLPVSPVTGRLDAFQWRVPLAELGAPVEMEAGAASVLIDAPREPREVVSPPLNAAEPVVPEPAAPPPVPMPAARPARPVPPIIPLAHVPDDPGPEPEAILDVGLANEPPAAGWQRIRQIFR